MKFLKLLRYWYLQELRNLHFFKQHWRYILIWPLVGVVLAGGLGWTAHVTLESKRDEAHARIAREAASLSRVYAKQMARYIEKIDELTLYVKYDWEASSGKQRFEDLPARGLFKSEYFTSFLVIGTDGRTLTSTLPVPAGLSFSDREYFTYHARSADQSLRISAPTVGRLSGKRSIHLTRRLQRADGSFAGVLVAGITLDFFFPFSDNAAFGKSGLFAIIGDDDVLRASGVGGVMDAPGRRTLTSIPATFQDARPGRRLGPEWFADGQPRIIAATALDNYPFRALVALSEQEQMLPFEATRALYYRAGKIGALVLLFFVLVAMYLSARLVVRKGEEEELRRAYRTATEGGHDGFYLWQIVRDSDGAIWDFSVVDCNERGADMYGVNKQQLMGRRFSHLYPGEYGEQLVRVHRAAYEAGVYEDEFEPGPVSRLRGKVYHRKMVRTREGVAVTLRDIGDLRQNALDMARLATEDALTGLPNRHWMTLKLPAMLAAARAGQTQMALLFIDLDDFKNVNDSLGHAAGDELLKAAAARLRALVRPGDSVVRLGGDEFTVILDPVPDRAHAGQVAGRIVDAFKQAFELSASRNYVGTSIGIGMYPHDGDDVEALLKSADLAMYSAKNSKGNFCFYESSLYERFRHRLQTERELHQALDDDQFVVHYQPRAATASGELVGFEALVRWQHPSRGMVSPAEFIPVAEASDLILKLGEVVMHKVCAQMAQWRALGLTLVPVSVNVSARQFNQGDVSGLLQRCLRQFGLDPALLEVELTESAMMGEGEQILAQLADIDAMGIKIHVDDFGTGYSSLALLQQLKLDVLKVDRAFTSKLGQSNESEIFFRAIVSMAHALGMSVVAEGVENAAQLKVLQALDCDQIQGYHIARPMPAAAVPALIARRWLFATAADAAPARGKPAPRLALATPQPSADRKQAG